MIVEKIFLKTTTIFMPYKKILVSHAVRITLGERVTKFFIFYFIEFYVFGTTVTCFKMKAYQFCPLF